MPKSPMMLTPTDTSEVLVAGALAPPGGCPHTATPTLTPAERNCCRREFLEICTGGGHG